MRLTHPHPIFQCIRCDRYYIKCHTHLPHEPYESPFYLLPCNPNAQLVHAQADTYSLSLPCQP